MRLDDATILIADDEIGLLTLLRNWFERTGCRVFTAETGLQALELAMANRIDLVISDILMPVMDGIALARQLKANGRYLPKIIFITAYGDLDDRDMFDLGIEAKLTKPLRREELAAVVRRCLMDRDERWREPLDPVPAQTLATAYPRLAFAREQGLIAFGRGGFCLSSPFVGRLGEPINLNLEFKEDHHALTGQGIVRWIDQKDGQIGVEIVYVDDAHRDWVSQLADWNNSTSFIPRTCARPPS